MKKLDAISYLQLNAWQKFVYRLKISFAKIPLFFMNLGKKIWGLIKGIGLGIFGIFKNLFLAFKEGDKYTRISFIVMGFGSFARKQILRGILFLLMEIVFIVYMIACGGFYLYKLDSLGTVQPLDSNENVVVGADNSFKILLYGVLTIFFIIAFLYTWYLNIKQNRINQQIIKDEKVLATTKDDLRAMVDKEFHKSLLALPTIGIITFTLLPILFMVLVAFTNYNANHNGVSNALFGWVGWDNFAQLFTWSAGGNSFSATFGEILLWTLIWAFFATFSNYFLGLVVAMLINKKGIKFKKVWRTILVMSIAIPQFISLLYVNNMFAYPDGIINEVIKFFGANPVHFLDDQASPLTARITVIIINIWIGIPYLMLVTTGILMNIPADLYESANIDGANVFQQFTKITLPYMLFVTGPYLLTSFTGNMNNFNVIYLLTGGAPHPQNMSNGAGQTDLLITWLFSLTIKDSNYSLGAVLGIMVFIIVAVISLIVYNILPSTRNEEEFQ